VTSNCVVDRKVEETDTVSSDSTLALVRPCPVNVIMVSVLPTFIVCGVTEVRRGDGYAREIRAVADLVESILLVASTDAVAEGGRISGAE
jgi:hypothetical protein